MAPRHHSSSSDGDSDSPRSRRYSGNGEEDYRQKRDRNNVAVRKSREKSRAKARETMQKVNRLKRENEDLEMKVKLLSKELNLLKDLFLSHAGQGSLGFSPNPTLVQETEVKTEESEDSDMSDDDREDYSASLVAGTPGLFEIVQKDHEYSFPASRLK